MEFAFTDEQRMIEQSAQRFLAEVSDSAAVRDAMASPAGHSAPVWQRIASELYWPALHIPERYGGLGLGFAELAVLLEQMGRHLLCSPFFATACLATPALLLSPMEALKAHWLGAIAEGRCTATLAFTGQGDWSPSGVQALAETDGGGYRLNGLYRHVIDGAHSQLLIVAARAPGSSGEAGISLFALPAATAGVQRSAVATLDSTRRLGQVQLCDVRLDHSHLLSEPGQGGPLLRQVLQLACIALAAEQTGGAQQALDLTLAYTRQRQQFGRAIASFQAIKHRCADMMLAIECARSASYYAACVAAHGLAEGDLSELAEVAATAKIHASEAFVLCASEAIQLHGGVGFTWEYDPHLYFKRARATEQFLGAPALHREHLARQILGELS
jgi:alkylation response protein AidB-like acyl-CoA dehydrogenase